MDQRSYLPEKMRDEHSGDEKISGTVPARGSYHCFPKKMLARKQEELRASIKELEDSISYIGWEQNFYDEVLSGKRPYVSNLIRTAEKTKNN